MTMTSSALLAVQKALFTRLNSTVLLKALVTGVFDDVPQGQAFPYVVVGEDTSSPWYSKTTEGHEVTTTIHTWSSYRGFKQIKSIHAEIIKAITGKPFENTEGYAFMNVRMDFEEVFSEGDGVHTQSIRHGAIRFRIHVQQIF